MRRFIRHPTAIPISYRLSEVAVSSNDYLDNLSAGGLCFKSRQALEPGTQILIEIPFVKPLFSVSGHVAWCRPKGDMFEIGVRFETTTLSSVRIVEQICYIEEYRRRVRRREGRELNSEEAALEWIEKYAAHFPR
jgi:Tfp pilus assembly protein PilZ